MENNICKLCQNTIADKTNSHILSHFLIKSAINYDGQNEREKENSYSISPQNVGVYFGQNTLVPHILEKIYNKELSQEEIDKIVNDNTANPYAIDYIFCSNCEKKFSIIESYFQNSIYQKLHQNKEINQNEANLIIRIFIYSLIWRMSIVRFNSFQLESKIEEKLRVILDSCIANNIGEVLKNIGQNKEKITSFPLIVTFFETAKESDTTENVIWIDAYAKTPYLFIINDLCFQFYTKESHIRSTPYNFFGLTDLVKTKDYVDYKENYIKIARIKNEDRLHILTNLRGFLVSEKLKFIFNHFRQFYKGKFNILPTQEQEYVLLGNIINSDINEGEKYSDRHILYQIMYYLERLS